MVEGEIGPSSSTETVNRVVVVCLLFALVGAFLTNQLEMCYRPLRELYGHNNANRWGHVVSFTQ